MTEDLFLRDQTLTEADFSGRSYRKFTTVNCKFVACDFRKINAREVSFGGGIEPTLYVACVFDGARLAMSTAGHATLRGCSFRDVRIKNWECRTISLVDCTFSGSLHDCSFAQRMPDDYRAYLKRDNNEIYGNDFSDADLVRVFFERGVDLSRQRLPAGPDYFYLPDAVAAVAALRTETVSWPDADRSLAETLLKGIERMIADGQTQIFGRRSYYVKYYPAVADRIIDFWETGGALS